MNVAAHTQTEHQLAYYYPEHEPRATDPHKRLFDATRRRMLATGIGCWICGRRDHLELHHDEIEEALKNGVDLAAFSQAHPEVQTEAEFLDWVESEGNMRVLCADHHRSPFVGIHHVPYPAWKAQRFWRKDLPPVVGEAK